MFPIPHVRTYLISIISSRFRELHLRIEEGSDHLNYKSKKEFLQKNFLKNTYTSRRATECAGISVIQSGTVIVGDSCAY